MKIYTYSLKIKFLLLLSLLIWFSPVKAIDENDGFILIITSYNPDTRLTADNINDFEDGYRKRGGELPIYVRSMNVENLSDIHTWKDRIDDILSSFKKSPPSLVVLLGQEAWSSFLSQDSELAKSVPAICGMVSSQTVILPDEEVQDLKCWMPESKYVSRDFNEFNIIGGYLYDYRIQDNLNLINSLYPNIDNLYFLSDNSLGGIIMQATIRGYVKNHKCININYIDGREKSFLDVTEQVRMMNEDDCVLVGTWRFDNSGNYVLKNTSAVFCEANPSIPVFSLSSVTLGAWAVGGYIPKYRRLGKDIAKTAIRYLRDPDRYKKHFHYISNEYKFDASRLNELNIDSSILPEKSIIIKQPGLWDKYAEELYAIIVAFIGMILIIIVAIYYIIRINKLKHNLELSAVELVKAKNKAEESNRFKSSFLANISHEIRTPLNAIVGFSEVLSTEELTKEEKTTYSDIINNNSSILLHLINDILDISRMEAGRMSFELVDFDIVEICLSALSSVEMSNRTKAKLRFESNKEHFVMKTDVQRLKQVLINLLSNAAKFTSEGEILLNLMAQDDKITIFVRDTGCGIPKDKKDIIFNRFEKLNEFAQGTGLGLAICRLIVENLNGDIWLDTEYENGAKFVVEIPVV